jgi:hypothetical protein
MTAYKAAQISEPGKERGEPNHPFKRHFVVDFDIFSRIYIEAEPSIEMLSRPQW